MAPSTDEVDREPLRPGGDGRPCVVIFNPQKVSDRFRELVGAEAARSGWGDPVWLETTEDDPGYAMTAEARERGAGLVVAAGGDGTVRVVASGLAESGVPLGVIPAGTGNLLARNLDLPLDEEEAVQVAFGDHTRSIDVIALQTTSRSVENFAVMAGIGIDAVIMEATDSTLKKKVGSLAYFVAAARNVDQEPFDVSIRVDDGPWVRRRAVVCVIGNVGKLQANLEIIPGAEPDDGLLNVLVASPRRGLAWIKLLLSVLARRHRTSAGLDLWVGRRVELTLNRANPYQLDGDTAGETDRLTAEIVHLAVDLRVPANTLAPDPGATDQP